MLFFIKYLPFFKSNSDAGSSVGIIEKPSECRLDMMTMRIGISVIELAVRKAF